MTTLSNYFIDADAELSNLSAAYKAGHYTCNKKFHEDHKKEFVNQWSLFNEGSWCECESCNAERENEALMAMEEDDTCTIHVADDTDSQLEEDSLFEMVDALAEAEEAPIFQSYNSNRPGFDSLGFYKFA